MAQSGYTPIQIYYSATTTNVPLAGNLAAGELAINTVDGKLFYKDSAGAVQVLATKGGVGSSSTTQVLYNSSGLVVGSANMTFNGTVLTSSFAGPVAATTLSASSTVSGTGFTTYLASPPAIGGTAAAAGTFTAVTATSVTDSGLTTGRVTYASTGGLLVDSANMTFNGTVLTSSFAGPVAATTLSASSTVSGTGFTTYLASPPAIGGTAAAAGSFTTLTASTNFVGRINPRALTTTVSTNTATPAINTDNCDIAVITGQTVTITSFTTNLTGTPVNGQKLWISITSTASITDWGASFESSTITLPTTLSSGVRKDVGFVWNVTTSKWRCVAVA